MVALVIPPSFLASTGKLQAPEQASVIAAGCTRKGLPHPKAIDGPDPQDREAAIEREKNLLSMAMTRARDEPCVAWHESPSRFLSPVPSTEGGTR